jgi:hypothetical protein
VSTEGVPEEQPDLYPDEKAFAQWKHDLAGAYFPWESAQWVDMPRFLSEYNIHDSYWLGFLVFSPGEAIALIGWDTYWTKGRVYWPDEYWIPSPLLVIKFARVYEISWYGPHTMTNDCISDAESRIGTDEEFTRAIKAYGTQRSPSEGHIEQLRSEGIYYTEFQPCLAGDPSTFSILHGGKVGLLCLNHLREVVPIPDLE